VQQLKTVTAEKLAIDDSSSIKLIYHGKLLADDKTVESYEIKEQGVIMVIATKKTEEQLQNDKDYQEHKEVAFPQTGCRPTRGARLHQGRRPASPATKQLGRAGRAGLTRKRTPG
jgi:hypothetical protein